MSNYREDEQRLLTLKTGATDAWNAWYQDMRSPFRLFFLKYSNLDDDGVTQLYQDTQVVFHRNVTTNRLNAPLQSTLKTYLFGIGKLTLRSQGTKVQDWDDELPELPIEPVIETKAETEAKAQLVRQLLDRIGEDCRRFLELHFLKGYVMDAVAEAMSLPSVGAARKRKFDCLKKLRALVSK